MTEIEQTAEELRQLREKQALHRRQLEENRQKALDKKKQTRRYVNLGKMVEGMIPGADRQSEDEILDYLEKHLPFSGKPIPYACIFAEKKESADSPFLTLRFF